MIACTEYKRRKKGSILWHPFSFHASYTSKRERDGGFLWSKLKILIKRELNSFISLRTKVTGRFYGLMSNKIMTIFLSWTYCPRFFSFHHLMPFFLLQDIDWRITKHREMRIYVRRRLNAGYYLKCNARSSHIDLILSFCFPILPLALLKEFNKVTHTSIEYILSIGAVNLST